jgi:hypothetical protein
VTYSLKFPAVRVFDELNNPDFIEDFVGSSGLAKYYTENTTDEEKELAKSLIKKHLFLTQARPEAFASFPDASEIFRFLRTIKPVYTDFIFQTIIELIDEFLVLDTDFKYNLSMDLTSTFDWWSANYPSVVDPFTGSQLPNSYKSYKDGDSTVGGGVFIDSVNSPFVPEDVGRYIWIGGKWRFYSGGGIAKDSTLFQSSSSVFSASDVGKLIYIPDYRNGTTVRIVSYVSPTKVEVDHAFTELSIALEFHVSHEDNIGAYEIVGYTNSQRVTLSSSLNSGTGIFYAIIEESFLLDEEAIAFYEEGEINVYNGPVDPLNLIDTIIV